MQPLRVDSKDWMWLANQNCTAIDANIYKPNTNICTQITKTIAIFSGQFYHYFTNRVRIWLAPHSHQLCLFVLLLRFTFPLPQAVDALIVYIGLGSPASQNFWNLSRAIYLSKVHLTAENDPCKGYWEVDKFSFLSTCYSGDIFVQWVSFPSIMNIHDGQTI